MKKFAIIGGSGFYELMSGSKEEIATPYGKTSVVFSNLNNVKIAFLARHGGRHVTPPHKVDYKTNIFALNELGYKNILSTSATGIIRGYKPGDLVLLRDFIAFHLGAVTFFDSFASGIKHVDMSEPYSGELNSLLKRAARLEKIKLKDDGVVAATWGPRFETKSEIEAFKKLGANLVSMTNAQECILANELGMNYAAVAVGTNYAAGICKKKLSINEVFEVMKKKNDELKRLFMRAVVV
ncbi:MAG: MTAP family purine nucleoside phosphorylase [Candidatus Micrarchaeota archaeon]|nr:MTAP family purine nucleoside phosphorylase [Candidatus Micrarchaeota archaeon]